MPYSTHGYFRIQSKQYLSEKSGQAKLHVIRNSFQTLPNVIGEINPKQYQMLLADSIQTLFYVIVPTTVSYYL